LPEIAQTEVYKEGIDATPQIYIPIIKQSKSIAIFPSPQSQTITTFPNHLTKPPSK
jgi:hypothetical protein